VAATIIDHFNRKTGRCDPALGSIARCSGSVADDHSCSWIACTQGLHLQDEAWRVFSSQQLRNQYGHVPHDAANGMSSELRRAVG